MPLRSAMRLNSASLRRSSRSMCWPKRRKGSCTSCGGVAVAMRLIKASVMERPLEGTHQPSPGTRATPTFNYRCRRWTVISSSASPQMNTLCRGQIIFLSRFHIETVIPGILVAGGADHPELRHGMLIGHGLGAQRTVAHLGAPHLAKGQEQALVAAIAVKHRRRLAV